MGRKRATIGKTSVSVQTMLTPVPAVDCVCVTPKGLQNRAMRSLMAKKSEVLTLISIYQHFSAFSLRTSSGWSVCDRLLGVCLGQGLFLVAFRRVLLGKFTIAFHVGVRSWWLSGVPLGQFAVAFREVLGLLESSSPFPLMPPLIT